MNIHNVQFVKSAASPDGFIRDGRPAITFSGRSNVGKSSVINRLLNRKSIARVGSRPGKTIHVNYFDIDGCAYFVDLPGYGYANVSKTERDRWGRLMEKFFEQRGLISLGVMIVDSRHKPTADDVTMAAWFEQTGCPMIVVANKCDKLKKSELEPAMQLIKDTLELPEDTKFIMFSAEKGTGRDELMSEIMKYC